MATFVLGDDQKVSLSVGATDDVGNSVALPSPPTWQVSDALILSVMPDAADPTKATVAALGKLGQAQISVTAGLGDPNQPPLMGTLDIQVVPSAATQLAISAGTPEHV